MKAFLSARGIEFIDRDVTSDPQAVREVVGTYNSRSTPTVVVGDEVMIGFDPDRLAELLAT